MPDDPILEIQDLSVAVGGLPYVRDLSLCVERGRFHGLLGPNGAGKTTLLRVLYRAIAPQSGEVRLNGRPQSDFSPAQWARHVGALVQGGGLLSGLTPEDIVEIGLTLRERPSAKCKEAVQDALSLVGLQDKARQDAESLSGGELQRCYFAQLLACDPEVYVLDEPTNHLDLHYQLRLLDEVRRRGRSAIVSFHDLGMAARYCDTVHLMQEGQLVAEGPPQAVLTPEVLHQHYRVDGRLDGHSLKLEGPVLDGTNPLRVFEDERSQATLWSSSASSKA